MKKIDVAGSGEMPNKKYLADFSQNGGEGEKVMPKKQPEFRLVQPEYDSREEKTVFKDVGAVWKNTSQKTGKDFYTLKIGKMKLLMFENQRLE